MLSCACDGGQRVTGPNYSFGFKCYICSSLQPAFSIDGEEEPESPTADDEKVLEGFEDTEEGTAKPVAPEDSI